MNYQALETAIIEQGAKIGAGTSIAHWVHICKGARIGERCSLGQNVFVGNKVKIGNHVKIENNVSVYDNVTLEDEVFCGPSMVFTNIYNPRSAIPQREMPTLVKKGASLGANCTIICGVTIGQYAFIGAGALLKDSVPDFALFVGVPAKKVGWMSKYGERLIFRAGVDGFQYALCPHTGEKYQLSPDGLVRVMGE